MNNLEDYHNEIEKWHIEALTSLTLYQQIRRAKAPNIVGSTAAKENLNTMSSYAGVFSPIQNATRISSFSNLSKIFIGYKNKKTGKAALSLDFLLQELELAKDLPNFDRKYLAQLKHKLKCNEKVKELRKLRNQQIAHIDLAPDTIKFSDKDFKDLLALSNDILMFSSWCINDHDQSDSYYQTLASDIEMDFMKLLNALKV